MTARWLLYITFLLPFSLMGQKTATLTGTISSEPGNPVEAANVAVLGYKGGTATDSLGRFFLTIPADTEVVIVVSHIVFEMKKHPLRAKPGEVVELKFVLQPHTRDISEFVVEEETERATSMQKLDPKLISKMPSASGSFEAILFSQPGVVSNNELSSQYSVRGGNFDENLVYVNDIEIYRPYLVRAGEQEGLSFVNPDLASDVLFSAGGFEAKYGDKMSSVLDVTYKEPRGFGGSVSASLLGASVHLEDASKNYRFTQLHGFRYRTNQYVLNSLDTQGDYQPVFMDYQGYFTYMISENLKLGMLGNISRNRYHFVPETRTSEFGTVQQAMRLTVFFDGQEINEYTTYLGALSLNYTPRSNLKLKLISSAFQTQEAETFSVEGAYRLDELERDLSKEDFGDVAFTRGVGAYLHHARNYLDAFVYNVEHKGSLLMDRGPLQWGLKYQYEDVRDVLNEWRMIDSAGYSIPQTPRYEIVMDEAFKAQNSIFSNRVMGYVQKNYNFSIDSSDITFTGGMRFNYWDFNNQLLFSPRTTLSWKPNWNRDVLFKASWGYYHQPPFYREMRDMFGQVNRDIRAQTSIHYVLGSDLNFTAWNRPFKFISEIYYKQLNNLVPYQLDNVRVRYFAHNNARGYATGIDMKINGEFVEGVDSWASLSVMKTEEDLLDDYYYVFYNQAGEEIRPGITADMEVVDTARIDPGFIPRPTDRRVNFGLFFQDYLPRNPTYKMHLNLLFGTGFPFGPPTFERHKDTLRLPPYRRVDIGFSKQLIGKDQKLKEKNPFRHFNEVWISAEVFNLFQINNTISYLWVTDVTNRRYAIPNYLTTRRINVKLNIRF